MSAAKKLLEQLSIYVTSNSLIGKEKSEEAFALFKKEYPGNYDIIEYYDSSNGKFRFKLKFHTEQDEMLFVLRNE